MAAKKEDLNVRRALDRQGAKGVGMFDDDEGSDGAEDVEMQGTERDKVRIAQAEKRRTRHGLVEDVEEVGETPVVHASQPVAGSKKRRTGGKVRSFSWLGRAFPAVADASCCRTFPAGGLVRRSDFDATRARVRL